MSNQRKIGQRVRKFEIKDSSSLQHTNEVCCWHHQHGSMSLHFVLCKLHEMFWKCSDHCIHSNNSNTVWRTSNAGGGTAGRALKHARAPPTRFTAHIERFSGSHTDSWARQSLPLHSKLLYMLYPKKKAWLLECYYDIISCRDVVKNQFKATSSKYFRSLLASSW